MRKRLWLFALSLFVVLGICGRSALAQIVLPASNVTAKVAGKGTNGLYYGGDGGAALNAYIGGTESVAVDSNGNLYLADGWSYTIRKVTASTGIITTVAGNGTVGYSGDGGPATSANIRLGSGGGEVAVDSAGNIYIADVGNNVVRKVTASTGIITTIAGNGTAGFSGDGGPGTSAELSWPDSVAVDGNGNVYIADTNNTCIRRVDGSTGIITTFAGKYGYHGVTGNGGLATSAELNSPTLVAVDYAGNVYENDSGIRKITISTGIISQFFGGAGATACAAATDSVGDGCPATQATTSGIEGMAADKQGDIYFSDTWNDMVRVVSASTGLVTPVPSTAKPDAYDYRYGVAVDQAGNIYYCSYEYNAIYAIGAPGTPTTTVVTSSDASIYYGVNVTFTATVSASSGTPTGSVTFYSDGSSIGSGTLSGGSTSVSTSSLAIGTHSITASCAGSGSFFASTSNPISQTITMVPTGITFTTSPNPSVVTNPVNVQIQVTASNGGTPSGSVSVVADGSNTLGTPTLNGSGAASLSTSSLSVGTHSITVSYGGTSTYDSSSVTQSQTVNQIPTSTTVGISPASANYGQCVTFTATVTATQGTATGSVTFTANSTSLGTATLNGSAQASVQSCSLQAGTYTVTASYGGATNYGSSSGSASGFTVNKITPGLAWSTPAPIVYGTALSSTQLNASAGGVAGTYTYNPGAGTVLSAGWHTLTCNFVPSDTTDYNTPAPVSVSLQVNKANPSLSWATPSPITYGTALSGSQLNASATGVGGVTLPGSYAYSPGSGAVLGAGSQTLSVTFTPSDSSDYNNATASVSLTVNKANPSLSWATPSPITYGTALSGSQLNASATGVGGITLPGSFAYSPVSGTVLGGGSHTLSVTFTPSDSTDYNTAAASVTLTVNKANPSLSWATPAAITYGTALSGSQLNASATGVGGVTLPGSYAYSPASGTVLGAGSQTLSVTFTPSDSTDYNTASASVGLTVNKANPSLSWATPAAITYGTALSGTQLNASATGAGGVTLPGSYAYSPVSGTVLGGGSHTLSVTFSPSDSSDYNTASASVALTVNKANPTITWANPSPITYGTALSATQLNAAATGVGGVSLPGSFTYSPVSGTVLGGGSQTLSMSFTPTDTTDYNTASASVTLTVNKANPTINWANPSPITYGTALSATQLNAAFTGVTGAALPGTAVYSPASGTVLTGGSQTLSVSFTPSDTTDYNTASASVTLTVNKANPTITWANPAAITYGTALSATQLNAGATGVTGAALAGTFVYNPASGTILNGGSHTLSLTFTPTDTTDYNTASASVTLTVNKANPTITWATPAAITYGTTLSATQLNAGATGVTGAALAGTFVYNPASGTVLTAGSQTLIVSFTPTDTTDYNTATVSVPLTVNQATPTITWPNPGAIIFGTPLSGTQLDATAAGVGGGTLPGQFVYTPSAGTVLAVGSPALAVKFTPTDTTDYTIATDSVSIVVNKATPVVSIAVSPEPSYPGDYATVTASVSSVASQYPTGTVTFTIDGSTAGTATLSGGTASLSYSFLTVGSHSITAAYSGDGSYNSTSGSSTHNVIHIPTSSLVSATPDPAIGGQQAITLQSTTTFPDLMPGTPNNRQPLTGTVQFFDGGVSLGTVSINSTTELAQLTVPSMTTGTHNITAVYAGDANYTGSTAAAFAETLVAPLSALNVSGNNAATTGANITYTAMVLNPLKVPQSSGTVTWTANGTVLGTSTVGASGAATYTASFPTPGVYAVVASYTGNQQPGTLSVLQTVLSTGTDGSAPFTMSGDSTTTMGEDGSSQATIKITSAGDGTPVALTCSGAPSGYTCNLSPSTITLTASGTPPTVTVSVAYNQPATRQNRKAQR